MPDKIINIALIVLITIILIIAVKMTIKARREEKKLLNKLREQERNEEKAAEIIAKANKTKADARTGDHSRDISYMADKLHDYAQQ